MTRTVGLFPGQGSQYVGMGSRLADSNQVAASVFDRAGVATGINVRELSWTGESSGLERTENAQLALTVFSLAAQSAFESEARTGGGGYWPPFWMTPLATGGPSATLPGACHCPGR